MKKASITQKKKKKHCTPMASTIYVSEKGGGFFTRNSGLEPWRAL